MAMEVFRASIRVFVELQASKGWAARIGGLCGTPRKLPLFHALSCFFCMVMRISFWACRRPILSFERWDSRRSLRRGEKDCSGGGIGWDRTGSPVGTQQGHQIGTLRNLPGDLVRLQKEGKVRPTVTAGKVARSQYPRLERGHLRAIMGRGYWTLSGSVFGPLGSSNLCKQTSATTSCKVLRPTTKEARAA